MLIVPVLFPRRRVGKRSGPAAGNKQKFKDGFQYVFGFALVALFMRPPNEICNFGNRAKSGSSQDIHDSWDENRARAKLLTHFLPKCWTQVRILLIRLLLVIKIESAG